jgi:quinol-cytochrome oxidoreductase complex cytochrome b subunit
VFFVVITIVDLLAGAHDRDWMDTYSNPLSSGVLAVITLGSLAVVPFIEHYARESVPRERWNDPVFKRINRDLTLMWGLVFVVIAVCGLIAVKAPATSDWTNWIVPITLIVGAFKLNHRYPDMVAARQRP